MFENGNKVNYSYIRIIFLFLVFMVILSENVDKAFFKENETVEKIVAKWDALFDFKRLFKSDDVDIEKLSLTFNDMAKYLIENDFGGTYKLNIVMFPIIVRLMRTYKLTEIDVKELVDTWIEKSHNLFKLFENSSNILNNFMKVDVEAEVCDLFSKIYVCKMIEDGKYKLEKVEN